MDIKNKIIDRNLPKKEQKEEYYNELLFMIKRFFKVKTAVFGLALITIYVFFAIFGDIIIPISVTQTNLFNRLQPPSWAHPFGTDWLGRDLLSLFIFASRTSLLVAVITITLSLSVGVIIGLISSYYGGLVDDILMRLCDILISFPAVLMAIIIISLIGPSLINVCLILALERAPRIARILRSSALSIKSRDYITASKALGYNDLHIMFRNILPNAIGPLTIVIAMGAAVAVVQEATLSFLGLGVPLPAIGFGYLTSMAKDFLRQSPLVVLIPALGVAFLALGFCLVADGLRDSLDPRLR